MEEVKWTDMLNQTINCFENYHTQKLYFLKESLEAHEYVIHPHLIASKWLMTSQQQTENKIVIDL